MESSGGESGKRREMRDTEKIGERDERDEKRK